MGGEVAITLIESDTRLGGKIVTERVDGFVVEGGPDSFLSFKPRGLDLCRELGLDGRLHGTNERVRRTYVMRGGKLYTLPEGLSGLVPARFGPLLKTGLISPLGKLRAGLEVLVPPRTDDGDESLAAFATRRFGREVYERLIEPLMGGIYAGDGERLSLMATFPQLKQAEREYGSIIRGMRAASSRLTAAKKMRPSNDSEHQSAFLTFTTGMAEIVEALETKLSSAASAPASSRLTASRLTPSLPRAESKGRLTVEIRLGTRVTRVSTSHTGYTLILEDGRSLQADAVILATPAFVTADLISHLDSQLADTLRAIPYVSTATVSIAYRLRDIPRPMDGYGYIAPRAEGRPILACTWTSTKFPHRAPEGFGLIRAFVGRAGQKSALNRTDEELLRLVREELRATLGITALPLFSRIFRWPQAMPQYTLGHPDRLAAIESRLAGQPGLFVAGSAYQGIGIPDCIASGERAAEKALAYAQSLVHV